MKSELEKKIKTILYRQNYTDKDLRYVSRLITEFRNIVSNDDEVNKFNLFCAKLLVKIGEYENAQKYLDKIYLDKYFSKYNLQFKIYLHEGK